MKRIVAAAAIVAAIAAIGLAGYHSYAKYEETRLIESLAPHVKNATIRVTNSTVLELESSHITYKELFDRLDADVAEIEKRSIEVQSIGTSRNSAVVGPVTTYLRGAQEFSRSLSMKYRKRLAMNTSLERFEEALRDRIGSSGYSREYAVKNADRAQDEATKAVEEAQASMREFVDSTKKLKGARAGVSSLFPSDALVEIKQLDALVVRNSPPEKPKS